MTQTEMLLTILAEECAEVAQRACKAIRFGLNDIQPGQPLTNGERIAYEYADLVAVLILLSRECPAVIPNDLEAAMEAKRLKVSRYRAVSVELGTLRP